MRGGENFFFFTSLGVCAFYGCSALKSITIPEPVQLQAIGLEAFVSCTALETITLPASVQTIGKAAFCSFDLFF